jgi:F-type H+-transporting ATPase subunit a
MEKLHHELWIVQTVNALLSALGLPAAPDHIVMCAVVTLILTVISLLVRWRISVENPGRLQLVLEDIVGFVVGQLRGYIGEKGLQFLPLVGTIFLFIFTANMIGKIPGLLSPTASLNTTVGCAVTVWIYYHIQGIRAQGVGPYLLHFAAPPGAPVWMAPIMLPIEIISHLSRMLSLSLRLFGNIFGEEMVVLIIASIIPFLAPLPMMLLGVVTGTLQAFIFALLTMIYLAGAVHTAHDHDEAHAHGASHEGHAAHAHA